MIYIPKPGGSIYIQTGPNLDDGLMVGAWATAICS
jgi:hypothetical protein